MSKNEELWLTKVKLGAGSNGEAFVLASGQNNNPKGILGWSGDASKVIAKGLGKGQFNAVALVGIVGDMTQFLPAAECKKEGAQNKEFCSKASAPLQDYEAERSRDRTFDKSNGRRKKLLEISGENEGKEASTGRGWINVRNAAIKGGIEGWNSENFKKWVSYELGQAGWFAPQKMNPGQYMKFWGKGNKGNINDGKGGFNEEFGKQLHGKKHEKEARYEWKETAVMR